MRFFKSHGKPEQLAGNKAGNIGRMGQENLLTDAAVRNAKGGAKLSDGGGLHLTVRPSGEKLWQYRFKLGGKENVHSIGAYDNGALPLKVARARRDVARELVREGKNPNIERQRVREANVLAERLKKENSFAAVYERWMKSTEKGLSADTARQRRRELERHAMPLMSKTISEVTRQDIVKLLEPIEASIPETARNG